MTDNFVFRAFCLTLYLYRLVYLAQSRRRCAFRCGFQVAANVRHAQVDRLHYKL